MGSRVVHHAKVMHLVEPSNEFKAFQSHLPAGIVNWHRHVRLASNGVSPAVP